VSRSGGALRGRVPQEQLPQSSRLRENDGRPLRQSSGRFLLIRIFTDYSFGIGPYTESRSRNDSRIAA
ncbi:MAG: hypothetical protein M3457_09970, partial [Chloroflexota bacterium]|nr:hypothetical protein [Chloroflexota bacterium]